MKAHNLLELLYGSAFSNAFLEHLFRNSHLFYSVIFILVFSIFIKFKTRIIFLKDHAEWLMGLSLLFYPLIIKYVPGYKIIVSEPIRYFLIAGALLILGGFIASSFIYNRWNILKALLSVVVKLLVTIFSYYFLLKLYSYYKGGYFTDLTGYLKFGGMVSGFFIILWLFLNGKRYLDGNFRLNVLYHWLGRIFLWSSLIFSVFLILKGYSVWHGLKVFSYGMVFFIFFLFLFKLSAWSHIRAVIARLGEHPCEYKVKVFFSDVENAFAYETSLRKAIGITDKFLKRYNLDEINFAIAHEIAHHRKSHQNVRFWTEVLSRGGIWIFAKAGVLTGWFGFTIAGIVQIFKKELYKSEEYEADELAVQYLKDAGLTQQGAITFFEKIREKDSRRGFLRRLVNLFLEAHPYPEKRLERIRGLVEF